MVVAAVVLVAGGVGVFLLIGRKGPRQTASQSPPPAGIQPAQPGVASAPPETKPPGAKPAEAKPAEPKPVEAAPPAKAAVAGAPDASPSAPEKPVGRRARPSVDEEAYRRHLAAGERKYRAGSFLAAAGDFRKALAIKSSAPAFAGLAQALYDANRPFEALEQVRRAIQLDPRYAPAYVLLGTIHQDQGRNAEARKAYQRYLELEPRGEQAATIREILSKQLR